MEKKNGLYELIYEYYESRILFGVFRYGEQMSSVPQICATFQLGRNTVQSALDKLEKKGYIETEERKVARIVYRGSDEIYRENAAKYFVPRKDGIIDFQYAGELLFLPMWKIGLHNLKLDSRDAAYWNQQTANVGMVPMPVKVYFDVLRTFHNGLLLDLYWQCLRYLSFLYPKRSERGENKALNKFILPEKIEDLKQEFDEYFSDTQDDVLRFIESSRQKYHLEAAAQIPFTWTIYRRRPQVRYTLTSLIISEILWERYPVGSYLPSQTKMAKQYHVSLSTVRRTLEVLHSLGVTRTYKGIGTKVCMESVDDKIMNESEIRENLRLHGEGLQILAMTVSGVTLFTLESVTKEKRNEFLQTIKKLQGKTSGILCIDVLLGFISGECPSAAIRECYGKLRELMAWGYILSAILIRNGQLDVNFTDFISRLEMNMKADNLAEFAGQWQSFIEDRMNFFHSKFPF